MDEERIKALEEKIELIEFRQQLLFDNDEVSRMLFEYGITHDQYRRMMDLMENYRKQLDEKKKVFNSQFETEMYEIVPNHYGDYHMCEYFARAFMEAGRWDEVFPALYGDMAKYKYMMEKSNE